MLTLYDWRLTVPECGRVIGCEGENRARRLEIETDVGSDWACVLDIEYSGGTTAALPLTLTDGVLWAELTRPYVSVPGPAAVTVRGRKGDVVKKSSLGMLFVADAAGEGEAFPDPGPGNPGEGGTTDHRLLTHRDAEGQHPMSSIDGLTEEIKRIPGPVEALTNLELEELLK